MDIPDIKRPAPLTLEAFADRLVQLGPRLMGTLVQYDRGYLARGLITLPQLWVLRQIASLGTCSMRALAQAQGVRGSTLTGQVDRLVALGLVRRFQDAGDRRTVLAAVTPKGRRILAAVRAERHKAILRVFRPLSVRDRTVYLDIFEKILAGLAASVGGPRDGRRT